MYPLSMSLLAGIGFAAANDETEHAALTACGYGPAFVSAAPVAPETVESARLKLDAAGVEYDKRLGLSKLIELLQA